MPRVLLLATAAFLAALQAARAQPAEKAPQAARSQPAEKVGLELNRLAPVAGGCQVYVVGHNGTGRAFATLRVDLVAFGGDGVVNGRALVELAPLDPGKTVLRLFELPGVGCDAIDRVLLNEAAVCEDAAGAVGGCTALVEPASRAKATLFK